MDRVGPARTAHLTFAVLVATVAVTAALAGRPTATLVATSTTLAVVARQVIRRRVHERAWLFVMAGVAILTTDAVNSFVQIVVLGQSDASGPITAAALPVGFSALLVGSLLLISPPGRRNPGALIDATLVAVTFSVALWVGLIEPHLRRIDVGVAATWSTVLIMLLLGGIAGALLSSWLTQRTERGALGYVVVSITAAFLGSAVKVLTWTPDDFTTAWWIALFWAVSYAGLAAACLHPAANMLQARPADERLTTARLVGLGSALLVAPLVVGAQGLLGRETDEVLLVGATLVIVPLVLARVHVVARLYHEAQARLAHLAEHDELTGLANRRAVTTHLQEILTRVTEGDSPGAVVAFVDLDDFKSVNDELGHPVGDQVLTAVSMRLRAHLRASDTVARFGGDEFLIVCEGDPERIDRRIREVLADALAEPLTLEDRQLSCRASVGTVVVRPGDDAHVDEVLSAADAAMYLDKGRPARTPG